MIEESYHLPRSMEEDVFLSEEELAEKYERCIFCYNPQFKNFHWDPMVYT
jgi:hypothetical protein